MASKSLFDSLTPMQRIAVGVVILVSGSFLACQRLRPEPARTSGDGQTLPNRNIRYGMPAHAKHDPASKDAFLIERPQYVVSYNDSKQGPNWVCWNLNKSDIAKVDRPARFNPDPDLPKSFRHITHDDYTNSGFHRGHMCPSKDRSASPEDNRITFYTTNIIPQSPKCNTGGWERFESHCRDLTGDWGELYIACGPYGQGGIGGVDKKEVKRDTVGDSAKVVVPSAVWKVVMLLPDKATAPNANTRMLAVWMPNDQTVPEDWKPYAVSVASVELRTGYKFFPLVPDNVAGPIKSRGP